MSILDISIFIISVLGILLEVIQNPIFWLLYIIAAILLVYEFLIVHLYGSSLLQIIYVVLSIYGWYKWTHVDNKRHMLIICHTSLKQWINYIILIIIISVINYLILKYTGDTDYALDAILTAVCIIATYMAALKQIESWFVFASTIIISVPLYVSYNLYFTSLSYLIFGLLDLGGGLKWLTDYKGKNNINA